MAKYAIHMKDGSVVIMETVGDAKPEECIAQWPPSRKANVVKFRPALPNEVSTHRK